MPSANFSTNFDLLLELERLAKNNGTTRSAVISSAIEGETLMAPTATIAKADDIVAKFLDSVSKSSDTSWLTVRNQAGELLMKRAALKHPNLSPAEAMAKVASQPDQVDRTLYAVQAIKSEAHFAAYKTALQGV